MNNSFLVQETKGTFLASLIIYQAEEHYLNLYTIFRRNCFYTIRGVMTGDPIPQVDPTAVYCVIKSFEGKIPDLLIHLKWLTKMLQSHEELFTKIKLSGGRFGFLHF
jgi:hypothetical protein